MSTKSGSTPNNIGSTGNNTFISSMNNPPAPSPEKIEAMEKEQKDRQVAKKEQKKYKSFD